MNKVKIVGVIILMITILAGIIVWTGNKDERLFEAVKQYEECVWLEYSTTPIAYYSRHGEYPDCDPKKYE